jgi:hypothetical protein
MAGNYDPDIFGAPASAATSAPVNAGFDADVFKTADRPASVSAAPTARTAIPMLPSIKGAGYDKIMNYSGADAIGGLVRGAGSIGKTLLAPIDAAVRAVNSGQPFNVGGYDIAGQDRGQGMDAGLDALGVDRNSTAFQTNKLGAEIAGTSGVGGLLSKGLGMIPAAAKYLPSLIPALQTGGMSAGGATGAYGVANRVAGGALTGAGTAGLVNPDDASSGALIGAALPIVGKTLAMAGAKLGAPSQMGVNPRTFETAKKGIEAGYVIPPNMIQPSFTNQVIESISGKQATQQIASMRNSDVTEGLVRKALGIADDIPLTQSTMENLRKTAGKAYADVANISPQAANDLELLKQARNDSNGWYKAYNRSASPDDLAKAKSFKSTANGLEDSLETYAQNANMPELVPALRDARKAIAKTYTVGRALNDATGTVDARILGRMYEKGSPLSDGLDTAGQFASGFPTITKSPMQVGSAGAHNLKAALSAGLATMGAGGGTLVGGALLGGPLAAAGMALPFIAPPIARSMMFRQGAQQGLLRTPGTQGVVGGLLQNSIDDIAPLVYRSGGLLGVNR